MGSGKPRAFAGNAQALLRQCTNFHGLRNQRSTLDLQGVIASDATPQCRLRTWDGPVLDFCLDTQHYEPYLPWLVVSLTRVCRNKQDKTSLYGTPAVMAANTQPPEKCFEVQVQHRQEYFLAQVPYQMCTTENADVDGILGHIRAAHPYPGTWISDLKMYSFDSAAWTPENVHLLPEHSCVILAQSGPTTG